MKALQIALTQLGVQESPKNSNWGPEIKKYLNSVGINFPASWCMAFVYWCNKEAQITKAVKSGGVLACWNKASKDLKSLTPKVGSIFIMDFGKGLGHTGFVEKFDVDFIYTVEGNSNDEGSREGFEVCQRKRKRSSIKGYLNYE
jgi:hypothetical protein